VLVGLGLYKRDGWNLELPREASRLGSQRFRELINRLFAELANVVGSRDWEEAMRAVCKLYYRHI